MERKNVILVTDAVPLAHRSSYILPALQLTAKQSEGELWISEKDGESPCSGEVSGGGGCCTEGEAESAFGTSPIAINHV